MGTLHNWVHKLLRVGWLDTNPRNEMSTSEVIGLLEAIGVERWMFLVVSRICVYVPPPILAKKTNLGMFFGVF